MPPDVRRYLSLAEVGGTPLPAEYLLAQIQKLAWRPALARMSQIAATIENGGGPTGDAAYEITHRKLLEFSAQLPGMSSWLHDGAKAIFRRSQDPIAHDEVIQFLQTAIILDSGDNGRTPTHAELAWLMFIANDHLETTHALEPDASLADLAGAFSQLRQFNNRRDVLRDFARAALLFERTPGTHTSAAEWEAFQKQAFGGYLFSEYFDSFIAPLVMESSRWGGVSKVVMPIVAYTQWFAATKVNQEHGECFLRSLLITREKVRQEVSRRADGLPDRTSLFRQLPLVALDERTAVALSPSLVQAQLRTGIWARYRDAAGGSSARWLRDFGLLFELWARDIAQRASLLDASLARQLRISSAPGSVDEVEDIVLLDEGTAVFFSVKGTLLNKHAAHTGSPTDAIAWHERFFFQAENRKNKRDHPGAVQKLDRKIRRIRAGSIPSIPTDTRIIPVIVTFDEVGDNVALYRWIHMRCADLGLLADGRTAPLCLAGIDDYEALLALAVNGHNIVRLLSKKGAPEWKERNLDALVLATDSRLSSTRLSFLNEDFNRIALRAKRRLFSSFAADGDEADPGESPG